MWGAPPVPWGLLAAAVIAVCVAASGWYVIHQIRKGDAAEIAALADVANRNADAVQREKALKAALAAKNETLALAQGQREKALEGRLAALREARETLPAPAADCDCRPTWVRSRIQAD